MVEVKDDTASGMDGCAFNQKNFAIYGDACRCRTYTLTHKQWASAEFDINTKQFSKTSQAWKTHQIWKIKRKVGMKYFTTKP